MTRVLIAGLPRSGTTWLAETIAAAPGVRYVHEPDTAGRSMIAPFGLRGLGATPHLSPGRPAPNYRLLWEFAFGGGWSSGGIRNAARVLRLASTPAKRMRLSKRAAVYGRGLSLTFRRPKPLEHVVVKTVRAAHALEWIEHEFTPTMIVVWRHPLNLVPSWLERGWKGNVEFPSERFIEAAREAGWEWDAEELTSRGAAVRARFENTSVWPPPEEGFRRTAWIICAETALLLETAEQHPAWIVSAHERLCLDPLQGYRAILEQLGIAWTEDVEQTLIRSNIPGAWLESRRRWAEEPLRWQTKLKLEEQAEVLDVARSFERESESAAAAWRDSPALGFERSS